MAGYPGYYLVQVDSVGNPILDGSGEPIISGSLVTFPQHPRPDPYEDNFTRSDIVLITELGLEWVYKQYDKRVLVWTFRSSPTMRTFLETLDLAVDGQRKPFLIVPDVSLSPSNPIFVRKQPNFERKNPNLVPALGGNEKWFDLTLEMRQIPTGLAVAL